MPKSRTRKPHGADRPTGRGSAGLDPRLGDSREADDGVNVVVSTGRRLPLAVVLPTSVKRLNDEQMAHVVALQDNVIQQEALRVKLDELVWHCRDSGISWAAIGFAVGTSAQAAQQRWSEADL